MFEGYKDYQFYIKCNECPIMLIRVIAENYYEAIQYAKNQYRTSYSIYADDRCNNWSITRA